MGLPQSPLPPSLAARALPLLLSQLAKQLQIPPSTASFPQLSLALLLLAQDELAALPTLSNIAESNLIPLRLLLHLAPTIKLEWETVISAIIAYTGYSASLRSVIESMLAFDGAEESIKRASEGTISDLLRPRDRAPNQLARILLALARAHPFLAAQLLNHDHFLPTIHRLYAELSPSNTESSVQAKADLLLLFSTIMGTEQVFIGKLRKRKVLDELRAGDRNEDVEGLLDASFWQDYQVFFAASIEDVDGHVQDGSSSVQVGAKQITILRSLRDKSQGEDSRLTILTSLFPTISLSLLRSALNHPKFAMSSSSSKQSAETLVAPLIEAILSGGSDLPAELAELRRVAARTVGLDATSPPPQKKRALRDNVFDDDLDLSKLRLKGVEDDFIGSGLPKLKADIPDHLRASILRLAQSQVLEEEEEARALREASQGFTSSAGPSTERSRVPRSRTKPFEENDHRDLDDNESEDDVDRRIKVRGGADGDASDQEGESESENSDVEPVKKLPREAARPSQAALQQQSTLELAYLRDASLFDRDSETRRSRARSQLREASGMDDSQLEGWRLMLERNPHKAAILAKHQFDPRMNRAPPLVQQERIAEGEDRDKPPHLERGGGERGGTGGRDGSRGRRGGGAGGGESGRGGRGGSSGGRGRGQNKGSRGHSNAARTRGHDRKMAKMGTGL